MAAKSTGGRSGGTKKSGSSSAASGNTKNRKKTAGSSSGAAAKKSTAKKPAPKKNTRKKNTQFTKAKTLLTFLICFIMSITALIGVCVDKGLFTLQDIRNRLKIPDNITEILPVSLMPDDGTPEFGVCYIDVGQGDSELIISGNKTVLIDSGESEYAQNVLAVIRSMKIKKLDYIIATHPHSDHIGGMADIIKEMNVGKIIVPVIPDEMVPTTITYENFLNAVSAKNLKLTAAKAGDIYDLGISRMEILAPTGGSYSDLNDYSVVCRIAYKDTSFMFTGDASEQEEKDLAQSDEDLFADVLKVGHHGSKTASTEIFLRKVAPAVCVISCGSGNKYGHPTEEALERLGKYTEKIYRTDISGTIMIYSDGERLYVKLEKK